MSSLVLPPHVQKRIDLERRAAYEAQIWRNVTAQDPLAQKYTVLLQRISPHLAIVKAHDTIRDPVPLRPGYYHLLQRVDDGPLLATALENNGAYAEPGDWIFDALNRTNWQERRVRDRLDSIVREEQEAIDRENQDRKAARMEKVKDIVNSATRAQISMDTSIPWTQNSQGRRPAK